jgi:hypothetical protein
MEAVAHVTARTGLHSYANELAAQCCTHLAQRIDDSQQRVRKLAIDALSSLMRTLKRDRLWKQCLKEMLVRWAVCLQDVSFDNDLQVDLEAALTMAARTAPKEFEQELRTAVPASAAESWHEGFAMLNCDSPELNTCSQDLDDLNLRQTQDESTNADVANAVTAKSLQMKKVVIEEVDEDEEVFLTQSENADTDTSQVKAEIVEPDLTFDLD